MNLKLNKTTEMMMCKHYNMVACAVVWRTSSSPKVDT